MTDAGRLQCPHCAQWLTMDDESCPSCASQIGFDPWGARFLVAAGDGRWLDANGTDSGLAECGNRKLGACNWLFQPGDGATMCQACRYNRTIPDLSVPGVFSRWRKVEAAKKHCIYPLIRLGVAPATFGPGRFGLVFDILYDPAAEQGLTPAHPTAHDTGFVTINLIEADDAARERARMMFGESYRTLVGHFRHEVGHYYWQWLVEPTADLVPFRTLFGDERADYGAAQGDYYGRGDAGGWEDSFVSRYATMHPWEDFAETFAHYLHIVEALSVIRSFGLSVDGPGAGGGRTSVDFDPFTADTATLVNAWIPLAFAINAANRSMGQPDLYPFRLTPTVAAKIDYVNRLLAFNAGRWAPGEAEGAGLKAMAAALGHGVALGG